MANYTIINSDNLNFKTIKCRCHGQRQLHFHNCQLSLSVTAAFDGFKFSNYVNIIIIVFNIEIYIKYLLFDKLHELMDLNIFVILF